MGENDRTEEEVNLVVELDGTSDQQYDKAKSDQLFADLHHLIGIPL